MLRRWVAAGVFAILTGLLVATWACAQVQQIGNSVLIVTAAVVFWYTVETGRLRRDAEIRTKREATPRIYFEIVQRPENREISNRAGGLTPSSAVDLGEVLPLRFILINHTGNAALALVQVRIKMGTVLATFAEGVYSGELAWEVTPFFNIDGYFNVYKLIADGQQKAGSDAWPTAPMWLAAQVDTYEPSGRRVDSIAKEYTLHLDLGARVASFWPEVRASHFDLIERPELLPRETRVGERKTEPRS